MEYLTSSEIPRSCLSSSHRPLYWCDYLHRSRKGPCATQRRPSQQSPAPSHTSPSLLHEARQAAVKFMIQKGGFGLKECRMRYQAYLPWTSFSKKSALATELWIISRVFPSLWMIVSMIRSGLGWGRAMARTPVARRIGRARVESCIVGIVGDLTG